MAQMAVLDGNLHMKRGMLKIDKILNFQGSLFCGFIDIKAKTDIILELLTNLQKEVFINLIEDVRCH